MALNGREIRHGLDRLVAGMTGLRHDGRFHEPNLDGTAGDYISFDSWEWPQGVGLYGLVGSGSSPAATTCASSIEGWYERGIARGPAAAQRQHHRADAGLVAALGEDRAIARWQAPLGRLGRPRDVATCRARRKAASSTTSPTRSTTTSCGTTRCSWSACSSPFYGRAAGRRDLVDEAVAAVPRPCPLPHRHRRPASGSTAGPSTAGTISPAPAGRAAMPGSRPASSISSSSAASRSR